MVDAKGQDEHGLSDESEKLAESFDLDEEDKESTPAAPTADACAALVEPGGHDRRVHPRMTVGMKISVRAADVSEFIQRYSLNISKGGLFIRCPDPYPRGTLVNFQLRLEGGETVLEGKGEVAWNMKPAIKGEQPRIPGMGLKFTGLSDASRRIVERIVEQKQARLQAARAKLHSSARVKSSKTEEVPDLSVDVAPHPETPVSSIDDDKAAGKTAEKATGATEKKHVLDALTTALEISDVPRVVESSFIRWLLDSWYTKLYQDNTVDLTLVWNMLVAEEEITVNMAVFALVIFERGRGHHRLEVRMPEAVEMYDDIESLQNKAAKRLHARGGFDKVMAEVAARPEVKPESLPTRAKPAPGEKKKKKHKAFAKYRAHQQAATASRKTLAVLAAVVVLVGFWLIFALHTGKSSNLDTEEFLLPLDIENAKILDNTVSGVITDSDWYRMGRKRKRAMVARTAELLASEGVRSITLFDRNMMIAAVSLPRKDGTGRLVLLGEEIYAQSVETGRGKS